MDRRIIIIGLCTLGAGFIVFIITIALVLPQAWEQAMEQEKKNEFLFPKLTTVDEHYSLDTSGCSRLILPENATTRSSTSGLEIDAKISAGKKASISSAYCVWKRSGNALLVGYHDRSVCDPSSCCGIQISCAVPSNMTVEKNDSLVPHGSGMYDPHPFQDTGSGEDWQKLAARQNGQR